MGAGDFDKRVEIQRGTYTRTALGDAGPMTWSTVARRWVKLEESGGRELYRAQQVDATVSAVITLRSALNGLTTKDRIKYGSRVFNLSAVLGADDRMPGRGQILHCTETVDED